MSEIKWEEPEAPKAGPGRPSMYPDIVAHLKRNPGRWAVIAEDASPSIAGYLKKTYGVETTVQGVKNNRAEKVFARWPEAA